MKPGAPPAEPGEFKLSLMDHLAELRTRLQRSVLAILILGGVALAFAKPIFRILVLPILQALPEGERALIQTSAVEELNTLIKVGLYSGLFLSAPVILAQLWGFVAPGLYPNERRMAVPFVVAGTGCFVAGAAFCYFAVLPPAFEFLLKPEEVRALRSSVRLAENAVDDAGRMIRAGDLATAEKLLAEAETQFAALPSAKADAEALLRRADALDHALDAADRAVARTGQGGPELREALAARHAARTAAIGGELAEAEKALLLAEQRAREAYGKGEGGATGASAALLLERHQGAVARLVAAKQGVSVEDWTRPMLSMKEQLNLVLVLLLAFGAIFEIPVVFALLAALGVVTGETLAKWRRYAIVANVIIAAILTPTGDPFNLALMAGPMILCYEAGIIAARIITARRRARQRAEAAASA